MHKQSGYTLLELLISITIFSALIIVSVAIFARTASTAARANVSRQKTEAARSVIDQISNDFRYVVAKQTPPDCTKTGNVIPATPANGTWRGYCIDNIGDALYMLIKYPGDLTYTAKTYSVVPVNVGGKSVSINVAEQRGCSLPNDPYATNDTRYVACLTVPSSTANLLNSAYQLDADTAGKQIFSGTADVIDPKNPNSVTSKGSLVLNVNVKPAALDVLCSDRSVASGTCYQLSTTLIPGGFQ